MKSNEQIELSKWDWVMFILSVYVVIEIIITSIFHFSESFLQYVIIIDTIICMFFLYDFFTGLFKSKQKIRYIEIHWIDFIGSIPFIGALRYCRLIRIFRVLRALRSAKVIFSFIYRRNSMDLFNLALLGLVVIVALSTFGVYYLERDLNNPHLQSIADYLWWSIYTVIGLGFGDALPVAPEGRFISVILMLSGIALVGMFTGLIVDHIIKDKEIHDKLNQKQVQMDRIEKKIDDLLSEKKDLKK